MTRIKLKYVDCFTDRHGHVRYYFRRGKGARISLPGTPGSDDFMEAYRASLAGVEHPRLIKQRGEPGTFDRLLQEYFESDDYARLSKTTAKEYRSIFERWVLDEGIGHRPVNGMQIEHVKRMMAKRAATPAAANKLLKQINLIMKFSIVMRYRADNPTIGVKKFKTGEWHTWTEEQIAAFESRWPVGTKERLAFALLIFTGQRRSDVVRMSWRDIDGDVIQVRQQKTGMKLWIPIHPELQAILAASPKKHIAILTTTHGKPFAYNGFGNWMADKIDAANLPRECVTHGLRKAAARRLAEAGCSVHEIAAITGHKTLEMVSHYTKAADQKQMARTAVRKLTEHN